MSHLVTDSESNVWKFLSIKGKNFLLTTNQENGTFTILLTNLRRLWIECLTPENILQRCSVRLYFTPLKIFIKNGHYPYSDHKKYYVVLKLLII